MPAPRHQFEHAILAEIATHPKETAAQMRRCLERWAARPEIRIDPDTLPDPRTIARRKREATEEELARYALVLIPQAFEYSLPWESAPAVLELWDRKDARPSVRLARHFWHVTQALGREMPFEPRYELATWLANAEVDPSVQGNFEDEFRRAARGEGVVRGLQPNVRITPVQWDEALARAHDEQRDPVRAPTHDASRTPLALETSKEEKGGKAK